MVVRDVIYVNSYMCPYSRSIRRRAFDRIAMGLIIPSARLDDRAASRNPESSLKVLTMYAYLIFI
jgi:hypothetical protein